MVQAGAVHDRGFQRSIARGYFLGFPRTFCAAFLMTVPAFSISFLVNADVTQIRIEGRCSTISCDQLRFAVVSKTPLSAATSTISCRSSSCSSRCCSICSCSSAASWFDCARLAGPEAVAAATAAASGAGCDTFECDLARPDRVPGDEPSPAAAALALRVRASRTDWAM